MPEITSQTLKAFRPQIEEELKTLGERLGIVFEVGKGTYDTSGVSGSFKLEMSVRETASGKSAARVKFERDASVYGLTADDFEREFTYGGHRLMLVGFNHKSPKNCLQIRGKNGGEYRLDLDSYKAAVMYEEAMKKVA